jgi:hypothetical protein
MNEVPFVYSDPHHTDHDGPEPAAMKPAIADTKMNNQRDH